jgi:hypothetical protein
MKMPEEREKLSKAILAAADRQFSDFKDQVSNAVEDRFKKHLSDVAAQKAAELFNPSAADDLNLDDDPNPDDDDPVLDDELDDPNPDDLNLDDDPNPDDDDPVLDDDDDPNLGDDDQNLDDDPTPPAPKSEPEPET